jgi:uncharacterized membrane protein YgcG
MRIALHRLVTVISCAAILVGTSPAPLRAQAPAATQQAAADGYSAEQLDALLAPIALYPDQLLTQILMASTYPLQVVEAARWVEDPGNKALTGDALTAALAQQSWDPSVKSLVPFPQVLAMMNSKLDWMQQLGYAMSVQESAVMGSVQRLRLQAQNAGQLKTTDQQVVTTQDQAIVIQPAQPNVVYVPVYNPTVVYGPWLYPAYPPVYLPPPPGYYLGSAVIAGLAFGAGVAIAGGLWGWATPYWRGGSVNINVNRYNNINVNRPPINNPGWRPPPPANRPGGGGGYRPPAGGPVGPPGRPGGGRPGTGPGTGPGNGPGNRPGTGPGNRPGTPGNGPGAGPGNRPGTGPGTGGGRPNVSVPGGVVRPPAGMGPGNRPPINGGGANRPGTGAGAGNPARPGGGTGGNPGARPGAGQPARPGGATRPAPSTRPAGAAPGGFSGMSDGRNASQFQNRGAQSRQQVSRPSSGGGGGRAQGGGGRSGGGGRR